MLRKSPLLFILIAIFVDMLGYGIVIPLLPFYVQRLGSGAAMAGTLGSLYALTQLFSGPVLGALSDRYGRRPVLLICLFGTGLAYLTLGLADSLALVFLAIGVDGVTGGNVSTAYAYIADVTTPDIRARGMGLAGAAFGLGLMAGPALGGLLSVYGLGVPAFVACGIALSNVLFGLIVLPESLPRDRRSPLATWRALNWVTQLSQVLRLAPARMLLLTIFMLNLAFAGLQTNFPLYSQLRFGWTATYNGLFFAFVGVCAVVVQGVLFGWIQPRLGERRLAVAGLALMASSLAGIASAGEGWMMYPLVALGALGSGISIPSLTGLLSQRAPADAQGQLMGGTQVVLNLAMIAGPTLAGVAFEQIAAAAPYWLGSGFALCASLLAWVALYRPAMPLAVG
ncbi:MAG: MFS transporter [Anaerolineae bacterium]